MFANTQKIISLHGVIDTAISDHSMIYCTWKIAKAKPNKHKELTFSSLKISQLISINRSWKGLRFRIDNPDAAYNGLISRFWKTLKQLGLPEKWSPSTDTCLEAKVHLPSRNI